VHDLVFVAAFPRKFDQAVLITGSCIAHYANDIIGRLNHGTRRVVGRAAQASSLGAGVKVNRRSNPPSEVLCGRQRRMVFLFEDQVDLWVGGVRRFACCRDPVGEYLRIFQAADCRDNLNQERYACVRWQDDEASARSPSKQPCPECLGCGTMRPKFRSLAT
jgi:hypothetical protein